MKKLGDWILVLLKCCLLVDEVIFYFLTQFLLSRCICIDSRVSLHAQNVCNKVLPVFFPVGSTLQTDATAGKYHSSLHPLH